MELTPKEISKIVKEAAAEAIVISRVEHSTHSALSEEDVVVLVALSHHLITLRERGAKVTWTIVLTIVGVFSTVAGYKVLEIFGWLPKFLKD